MDDYQHWAPEVIGRKQPTAASCFKSLVEMSALMIDSSKARQQVALLCLYGWDISLLPDVASRETEIRRLWEARDTGNKALETAEKRAWFEQEIQTVISQRIDYFPFLHTMVSTVEINTQDRLVVTTEDGREQFELQRPESRELVESLGQRITKICKQAEELEYWLFDFRGHLDRSTIESVVLHCGVLRVELSRYRELAKSLNAIQNAPSPRRVTGEWVKLASEGDCKLGELLLSLTARFY